ncbi:zinc finger and SCAN domain-containing protein 30-like isoform X2 [Lacerta agilis]|uniref:zinc finger and SCAN domain-containing protein 30-like isoform X2 n=1 Tax=Lacerta agilis TaxID=80427 RepID=UPI00141A195B|nr:zinc finger and SCAN domain-containing protein 30-like isoform X2 [Lacerta agilis]
MQSLPEAGIKMEEQDLNWVTGRIQVPLAGVALQRIKQEPGQGPPQGWESQWQKCLPLQMQAPLSGWKSLQVPQHRSMGDHKDTQVSFSRWPGRREDSPVKVKEEILDEDAASLEMRRQSFRQFCYLETDGPRDVCNHLQELCYRWLKPDRHTKEQIVDLVVLEQFLTILPQEMQSWVWKRGPGNCTEAVAQAEDFLMKIHREAMRTEQEMPGLSEEGPVNLPTLEQNSSLGAEIHLLLEAKQEGDDGETRLVGDMQVRMKEEDLELERLDCMNVDTTSLKSAEGLSLQATEEEVRDIGQHRPIHHQEVPLGTAAEHTAHAKECDERSFQGRIRGYKREKMASDTGKSLSQNLVLLNRQRIQKREKPFKCSYCGKISNGRTNLMIHERTHTGEKPYECSECGKSFSTTSNLINHKRVHTGEKPYTCLACGQSFSHNASLIRHRRTHTGEKPYECSDCGKSFIQKGELIAHKRTHTGEKPYECAECGRSFSTSSHLIRHKRVHMGVKRWNCVDYSKGFHRKLSLMKHKGTYTEEK